MAAGLRVGLDDFLYRNSGTYGTPTWALISVVRDLTLPLETDKAEVRSRANVHVMTLPTHKKGPLEFSMLDDTSNADRTAIRDAWVARTSQDIAIADGPIATAGTEYWRADYYTYGFKKGQPLGEVNTVDVTMDLAYSTNPQGFTTVGS